MSPPLRLDYAVNDADVIAAFKRQQAEMEKERKARQDLQKQIDSNSEAQKKADKASAESMRLSNEEMKEAKRILDALKTPQQQHADSLGKLKQLYDNGRLSLDQYTAAVEAEKKKLTESSESHKLSNEEMKEAKRVLDAIKTPQQQYLDRVGRLKQLHDNGRLSVDQFNTAVTAERKKLAEAGDAADKSGGLVDGLTGKMAGFVGGLASAAAVIGVIKAEYDALIERQGKSRDANISLGAEQEALNLNLGGADAKQVHDSISAMSAKSGVKTEDITRAVNDAMAARGDLGVDSIVQAVGSVAKIRKHSPSEMAGLAAATVDTQKQTGLGTDESLGFLLQMQAQSRTKNLKGLAENFTPAVGGMIMQGAKREDAGALLAALSHGMGDTTGAQSKTSGISLAEQLKKFSGGQDLGKVIADMQQNPELRKQFLDKASFEVQARPAIEQLLTGGSKVAGNFASARAALEKNPLDTLKETIASRGVSDAVRLADDAQAKANLVDQQKLGDVGGAQKAVNRDALKEFRDAKGGLKGVTGLKGMAEDLVSGGGFNNEETINVMRAEIERMKQGKTDATDVARGAAGFGGGWIVDAQERRNAANPETKKEAARLEKLLEELVANSKQQLAANQNNANAGAIGGRRNNQNEGGP